MHTEIILKVSNERLAEVLCSAYESGSAYWAKQDDGKPSPYRITEVGVEAKNLNGDLSLVPGFSVTITDHEADPPTKHRLTLTKLRKGLQVMAEKYPRHFADVLTESGGDGTTGDVLLQCALFGELVYG